MSLQSNLIDREMSECHGAVLPSSCVQNGNVAVESPLVENGDDASDHVTNKNKAANEVTVMS